METNVSKASSSLREENKIEGGENTCNRKQNVRCKEELIYTRKSTKSRG